METIGNIITCIRESWDVIVFFFGALSIFVEFRPQNKFKLWSNLFKWIGRYLNSEIRDEIKSLNNKINENHDESMQAIAETNRNVEIVDINRKQDTQAILRDRITQMYHYYLSKGYILENDKKDFNAMFTRYTLSGGNSYVKDDIAPFMDSLPRFLSHGDAERFYEKHGNYDNGTQNK